ncbi:mitochondrial import inner membrane translocase subunit TIM22 [Blastocystis sp. subtype 4]|uniref:mitochondrial import inner membrane translocase subunit TIM22 n=1 Tax=Blastocystis sp. subtype 4 TaxID=944170 RepID=UPI0007115577|nr:mitochondrial import inner membrane translocase subunit TIM22 [Blastocystis sp. subtype 4]KNB43024.1 mitochondrial import inner membrane translocase subunit TIM22 [Blastocystis sp. subtype 4]|eukprot:XP_014526467.1 mitochondrial import inner membrane translocase subunit TIM22 [Blastocystis sp. subtype 4]
METDPQELEKLLQKKKPNTGPFPMIDTVPNKESFQFLINPPVKSNELVMMPSNIGEINNSCFIKFVTGGIMAAAMGGVFGFFMGSFSQMSTPMMNASGPIVEPGKASVGSEFKKSMRFTYLKGKSTARSMALFGGVYTALECVTERILGTKSIWTNALAGCGAGLAFGAKKGPMSACMSCVGFAAFGIVIDMFMF